MASAPLLSDPPPARYGSATGDNSNGLLVSKETLEPSPRAPSPSAASLWSKLFFSYADPVLALGNTRQLSQSDLWTLEGDNRTSTAFQAFKTNYVACGGSVERALLTTYGGDFLICGLGSLVTAACGVFAPVVLHHVIDAFSSSAVDTRDLALWLGAFFASRLVNAFVSAHVNFQLQQLMIRSTASLKCLIFEKAMRRNSTCKGGDDSVDIANLFTADMDQIVWCGTQLNAVWIMPLQIAAILFLIYCTLGLAVLASIGVIGTSFLVNLLIAKKFIATYEEITSIKDGRMKVVKEAFSAIQVVKLNAWEPHFLARIRSWRTKEMHQLAKYLYVVQLAIFLFFATPMCVSVASFAAYVLLMGETLTPAKVFTSMVLFGTIRGPLSNFPEAIQTVLQARVSLGRIETFLAMAEFDSTRVSRDPTAYPDTIAIKLDEVSISWQLQADKGSTTNPPLLSNVNLEVERGDFVVVHGAVGAGKSSLCAALLGEIPMTSGKVFVRSERVAYYSQQPWIQNMSVRDNILFGQAYDADKYERVLDACGLVTDVQQFPAGDATEIGQKGINLSGGQKARLSLARACYSDADVFILDSPLAAVDAVVQSEIFSKCICRLLESKTVILVTHNPEIIASRAVDVRVEVSNGGVRCERLHNDGSKRRQDSLRISRKELFVSSAVEDQDESPLVASLEQQLTDDEERAAGRVSRAVFAEYFKALGGRPVAVLLVIVLLASQGFQVATDFWLSNWTGGVTTTGPAGNGQHPRASERNSFAIYGLLALTTAGFFLARALLIAFVGLRASRYLFDAMSVSLLRAPLRFFDANPIGRILNRFSDDISQLDVELPFFVGGVVVSIVTTLLQLATAIYVIRYAGVLFVPLALVYVSVGNFYLAPSRELARLLKVAGSPVLSHVTQSEEGVAVIRAFGPRYVQNAIKESCARIDENSRVWFADTSVNQWFAVRIQLVGCGVVMLVVAASVWLRSELSAGLVGLAFMYAVSCDEEILYLVNQWARLELAMVSPERIMEYVGIAAEGEDKAVSFDASAHPEWPQRGRVAFEDVVFAYKPGGAAVLKRVSFEVFAREKVGIVGRTGAGKSSLTMALFRINELEAGRIVIDGVDIACVDVRALRSRLSIIPQSPVLFKGSLRAYMDPFDEFSDASVWSAVEKAGLKDLVTTLDGGLWHELSENGENLSVGERQLLCLSRALLREARVVVLDEATASIDHATERRLQATIAREFASATVLTIAHRLATVLESDRILVLDGGRVVEFDTPRSLAQKGAGGVFYELAREGGYLDALL